MGSTAKLWLLILLLAAGVGLQQGLAWKSRRGEAERSDREQARVRSVIELGEDAERVAVRSGLLWTGDLADDDQPGSDVVRDQPGDRERDPRRIAGTIRLDADSASVEFELHECPPPTARCSSGGVLTLKVGSDRRCVVSVGLCLSTEGGWRRNDYRLAWEPRHDDASMADSERLTWLRSLVAGGADEAEGVGIARLLQAAYADGPPAATNPDGGTPASERLVRAILRSIIDDRISHHSIP